MKGERLTKRADALRVEGRRRRGRPRLRWEDCMKKDVRGVKNESGGWGGGGWGEVRQVVEMTAGFIFSNLSNTLLAKNYVKKCILLPESVSELEYQLFMSS